MPTILRTNFVLGIVLIGLQATNLQAQSKVVKSREGAVYLHETFENYDAGVVPQIPQLQRVDKVTVVDGGGRVGAGKVAHFDDNDSSGGGAMEYNVGTSALDSMYIEFDVLNNAPDSDDQSSSYIFGVGPWSPGKNLVLNAKSNRAFGFEMYQQKYLKLRVGNDPFTQMRYDPAMPLNVRIWVNDHDSNTLSYLRPDNGESALLSPNSVVVWVNNALMGDLTPTGCPLHKDVTKGNAVIGRAGFSSASTKIGDFLIDNLHIEDPRGESIPMAVPDKVTLSATDEITPDWLPGAETFAYRDGDSAMNLFVYKPEDWKARDKRSAFIYFFGGGWTKGTPKKSASVAAWAANNGMVRIAPDYRTKNRFDTSPLASVADGRPAFNWVLNHAEELGVDPTRVAVGGTSAGGHVALWTAIENAPPGSEPAESPKMKPAAVFLTSAVTDTSPETGYTPARFGNDALALSPVHQVDATMPPTIIVHAAFDELVHYSTAVALYQKLTSTGNASELITVPVGGHGYSTDYPEWKPKVRAKMEELFRREGLLPAH